MAVHVTVKTGHAQARTRALAIFRGIELFLRKRSQQHPKPVKLNRGQDILEQLVVVVNGDDFPARHIPQFRTIIQEDRRWKFRQKRVRQVEIHIDPLQPGKHIDLNLGEYLPPREIARGAGGRDTERVLAS